MAKKKLTKEEKAQRNKEVVDSVKSGESKKKVAKKFKLSEIWIDRIVRAAKKVKSNGNGKKNGKKNGNGKNGKVELKETPKVETKVEPVVEEKKPEVPPTPPTIL